MSQLLTASRAAHLIGVTRAELQRHIASGALSSHDGMIATEDLLALYPEMRLEDSGAFERVTKIREEAFAKRIRERVLPNQETLAQQLAEQSEELNTVRRRLAHTLDLIETLRDHIDGMARTPAFAQLADLTHLIDQALATAPESEKSTDAVAIVEHMIHATAAHVTVKPSGHDFFVTGRETILEAALRAGLAPSYGCSNGQCGLCKARIAAGQVKPVRRGGYALSAGEHAQGYTLLCTHTAASDLTIDMLEAATPADIPMQETVARVKRLAPLAADVVLLHLETPRARRLRFLAGQGVALSVSGSTGNFRGDYPVASCPCDDRNLLFHIFRDDNDEFARRLFAGALKVNDPVSLFGPFGNFVLDRDSPRNRLFVVCDAGFASARSLIEQSIASDFPGTMHLIWAATRIDGHYQKNPCRAWAAALETFGFSTLTAADPQTAGTAAVQQLRTEEGFLACDIYLAGPADFVETVAAELAAARQAAGSVGHLYRETL